MAMSFAGFVLDPDAKELRDETGVVQVEPLVFELISYLAANAGRLVSKQEIVEAVWHGSAVSDSAVSTCINSARRVLGDKGKDQKFIRTVHGRGVRFDVYPESVEQPNLYDNAVNLLGDAVRHETLRRITVADQAPVRFLNSYDGTSIAHTEVGAGYPMAIAGAWMTHLEREWEDPAWRNYLNGLAQNFRLFRYDQRGNGLSEWDQIEINFERMVEDLEVVIEHYGQDQLAIWGSSQGAAVAAAYAARYPDRVSHLILYGGYARGRRRRGDPEATAESEALVTLIRQAWGRENPAIRQTMTSMFMPDASAQEAAWFNDFQRACGPAENIAEFREVFDSIDIVDELDGIRCPTLVIHCVGDAVAPLAEGRLLASRISDAQLVTLDSNSHMMTERDPEFSRCMEVVRRFMGEAGNERQG